MVRPGRDLLHGNVEIDETYVGGKKKGGSEVEVLNSKKTKLLLLKSMILKDMG